MTNVDTTTIQWSNNQVHHDIEQSPIERVERDGYSVYGYTNRPESLNDLLCDAVTSHPDRDAFRYPMEDKTVTYREFDKRVDRIAAGLATHGVEPGDIISLFLSNRSEFVELFFACVRLGAVVAPINTRVSKREFKYVLKDADPTYLVTEAALEDMLDVGNHENTFVLDSEHGGNYTELLVDKTPPSVAVSESDPASVLYTSGTTGHPKGCIAEHFHLVNAAMNYQVSFNTGNGLRSLVNIPLFHVAGLVSNLLHTVWNAGTTVVLDGAGPERFLETIQDEQIEYVLGVPTNYILAMEQANPSDYDLSSWEIAAYGGAPMPSGSIQRLREVFPDVELCDAYGTTETVGGLVTICPDEYSDSHADTIGLPSPPMELAVVDEDRGPLGPETVGELAIRGPIVIQQYLNRPEDTTEAFDDGWHYTGDLAQISKDGFVELKGRNRDKIVRGGENIYALDIEEVIVEYDGVIEASVTSFPDAVLGERVLAAVVPKPDVRLTEDKLREHCLDNLADYKVPEIFRIVNELPKNSGGKVMKDEIVPAPLEHGIQTGSKN